MSEPPKIEGFEIIKKLGEGATGSVWQARQVALDRVVALKVLHPHIRQDSDAVEKVRREATMSAKLSHPNFVRVYDICEQPEHVFVVMEYVKGNAVADWLRDGVSISEKNALLIAENVAFALEYLWNKARLTHSDLKPGNVLVAEDGTVKVCGSGMAKIAGVSASKTAGINPHYMSPEEARGEEKVDQRSDIYSLGALLYHMMTGRLPFDQPTVMEVVHELLNEQLEAPQSINSKISTPAAWLIEKMMVKDRAKRQQDWNAVLEDIAQVQGGYLPLGRLPGEKESAVLRSQRRKTPTAQTKQVTRRVGERGKISSIRVSAHEIRRHLSKPKKRRLTVSSVLWWAVRLILLVLVGIVLGIYFSGGTWDSFHERLKREWDEIRARVRRTQEQLEPGEDGEAPREGRRRGGRRNERGAGMAGPGAGAGAVASGQEFDVPTRIPLGAEPLGADQIRLRSGASRVGRIIGYRDGEFSFVCTESGDRAVLSVLRRSGVAGITFAAGTTGMWKDAGSGNVHKGTLIGVQETRMRFRAPDVGERAVDLTDIAELAVDVPAQKVLHVSIDGKEDLGRYVVWGKVTLFLFSQPTEQSSHDVLDMQRANRGLLKHLTQRCESSGTLYLRIIEVRSKNSYLARKLKVPFLPCVVVYDRVGRKIGNANASPLMIEEYIKRAKRTGLASA